MPKINRQFILDSIWLLLLIVIGVIIADLILAKLYSNVLFLEYFTGYWY
jgi:hypothetical protein